MDIHMYGAHFSDTHLNHVSFTSLRMRNVRFFNCNLMFVRFQNSTLENVEFYGCEISISFFTAKAKKVTFNKCDIKYCKVIGYFDSDIYNITFKDCKIGELEFPKTARSNIKFNMESSE
ncbi:hypothetical protein [Leptospira santarosai]|uniref:pentapeptide repeat-containing protein n=1 Tax=Leptospira santarosai TaxID=28183 RepID=UPI003D15F7C5